MNSQTEIENCPVLRPTVRQFSDFRRYIEWLDKSFKKDYGMVKVIPPRGWIPHVVDFEKRVQAMTVQTPIEQNISGKGGIYECMHIPKKTMTYNEFKTKAVELDHINHNASTDDIEQKFWKNAIFSAPLYGADVANSLMDERSGAWNLNALDSILKDTLPEVVKGVNSPYCYVGSWKAFFCWHTQDLDLSGINFLHQGKSKFWYAICKDDRAILQAEFAKLFPDNHSLCKQFLRHKTTLINPYLLKRQFPHLRIAKMEQKQHQFMIVFGGSYHCGFNFGFNLAEAINFATLSWLTQLPHAQHCMCLKSSVKASALQIYKNLMNNPKVNTTAEYKYLESIIYERVQAEESQEQFEAAKKGIVKEFSKRIKKFKTSQTKILYKDEEYEVVPWAQCEKCNIWRVLQKGLKKKESFQCRATGRICFKRDKVDRPGPRTITIQIDC